MLRVTAAVLFVLLVIGVLGGVASADVGVWHVPLSPIGSCRCPITPSNRDVPFSPFSSYGCPMTVEGAPESNCSLRCGRMPHSPRFQLRNLPTCNLPPRGTSCTRVTHRQRSRESRAL